MYAHRCCKKLISETIFQDWIASFSTLFAITALKKNKLTRRTSPIVLISP